jgi:hypothetical protein
VNPENDNIFSTAGEDGEYIGYKQNINVTNIKLKIIGVNDGVTCSMSLKMFK